MFGKNSKNIVVSILITTVILSFGVKSYAQNIVKDTDLDGLTDQVEKDIYKTNINDEDTDSDGVLDAQEVLDGTNPLDATSNVLKTYKAAVDSPIQKNTPIQWYIGRIAGIGAFIMFTLVVCMGLLMTSRFLLKFPFLSAPNALEAHSFNATYVGLVLVVLHFLSFMFDDVIRLKLSEVFIPFVVERNLKSAVGWNIGLPISIGVIAFYLMIMLVVTSRLRRKVIPVKIWRALHYSSFLFYITFLVHAYLTGTDSQESWMVAIYATSAIAVFSLLMLRIFGKKYFLPKITSPIVTSAVPTIQKPEEVVAINA